MENKNITGYPSIDKPWLKYYPKGAEESINNIPTEKSIWDVIEEKLIEYRQIPAIEYFGHIISRDEFREMVYTWARAFKAMGVKQNEIVSFYGPMFPDIGAMLFALNMIGACPYFLKLAISPEALTEETCESRVAVVFDDMWRNVSCEFTKDRFERIIIITAADGMSGVKKTLVSAVSKLKGSDFKGEKYCSIKQAKAFADKYNGNLKAPFISDRPALITSSSGTTAGGIVKGVVATNEAVIAQVYSTSFSDNRYALGDRTLNHFPPTAATSLNVLFFVPLFSGATVIIDPRVSENDFYNQLTRLKPNVCINTSSLWQTFYNRLNNEIKKGKSFDFSRVVMC